SFSSFPCIDDHGSFRNLTVSFSPTQTSLRSVTSTMITSSNSLFRERDAHSSARRSTSRHVRYRAVPRTNRTLTTANTHNHFATSSTSEPPASVPSLPWQCSCVDAPPGECTDVATPDGFVLPPGLPPLARNATTSYLAC